MSYFHLTIGDLNALQEFPVDRRLANTEIRALAALLGFTITPPRRLDSLKGVTHHEIGFELKHGDRLVLSSTSVLCFADFLKGVRYALLNTELPAGSHIPSSGVSNEELLKRG